MRKLDVINDAVKKVLKSNKCKFDSVLNGWHGWEKWFQVELTSKLQETGEAFVEDRFSFNKNKKLSFKRSKNSNGFVDVVYRHKGDLKDQYTAIEIKINNLKGVLGDLIKIRAIKNKEWSWRAVFVIFICNSDAVRGKYPRAMYKICNNYTVKKQQAGDFDFFVFGWEPNSNKTEFMTYDEYKAWLDGLINLCKEEDVQLTVKNRRSGDIQKN